MSNQFGSEFDIFQAAKCIVHTKLEKEKSQKEELEKHNAKHIETYESTRACILNAIEKINGINTSSGPISAKEVKVSGKRFHAHYTITIGIKKFCYIQLILTSDNYGRYSKVKQILTCWQRDSHCANHCTWTSVHYYDCKVKTEQYIDNDTIFILRSVATHLSEWL